MMKFKQKGTAFVQRNNLSPVQLLKDVHAHTPPVPGRASISLSSAINRFKVSDQGWHCFRFEKTFAVKGVGYGYDSCNTVITSRTANLNCFCLAASRVINLMQKMTVGVCHLRLETDRLPNSSTPFPRSPHSSSRRK
jgi:hypothetical protein